MILNELKLLIKNRLVRLICFVPDEFGTSYEVLIISAHEQKKLMIGADRVTGTPKKYSSIDRAIMAMQSYGYQGNFEIRFQGTTQ